jgi:hypothetical protein
MASVQLDSAQCDAIRNEIRVAASGYGDIALSMGLRGHRVSRDRVVGAIERLEQWVTMLDAIGWKDQPDGPDELCVAVDPELLEVASVIATNLDRQCEGLQESSHTRRTLDALRLIEAAA